MSKVNEYVRIYSHTVVTVICNFVIHNTGLSSFNSFPVKFKTPLLYYI